MTLKFNNRLSITPVEEGGGQPAVIEQISITPTASAQTIVAPEGVDGYSPILVDGAATEVDYSDFSSNAAMTLADGIIYRNNISGTGYIDTGYNVTFTPEQWEKELIIQAHIKTPSSFNDHGHWILGSTSGSWNTGIGLTINKDAGYTFWFMLGQSDTTLSVDFSGTTVPQLNTEYWVRLYKPNTENESHDTLFQISTDGINWTTEASRTIANISSNYTTTGNIRLMNGYWGDIYNQFEGGIYFDADTYISVDGEKIWYLTNQTTVKTTKFGATIENFFGNINASGKLLSPDAATLQTDLVFTGVKDLANGVLQNRFNYSSGGQCIKSVLFPDLETITGSSALNGAFNDCRSIEGISMPKLKTVTGSSAMRDLNRSSAGYSSLTSVSFPLLETISGSNAFSYAFYQGNSIKTVSFPSLKTIANNTFESAFNRNSSLESVDFSSLEAIPSNGFSGAFTNCSSLTSVDFSSLESIASSGLREAFYMCSSLASITFPALDTIDQMWAMADCFRYCTSLASVSFPALTSQSFGARTDVFTNMLASVTGCTVHFPSNLQSVIGSWSDVTNGFGGTDTVVLFDLTATE